MLNTNSPKKLISFTRMRLFCILIVQLTMPDQLWAQEVPGCGSLNPPRQFGPHDYRNAARENITIVTGRHFTPEVEALVRGNTTTRPGGDIDYTLRAIPNNHRALIAIMRLGEKEKTTQPAGTGYSIQCWFERAIVFRPDDGIVRMIYSTYLKSKGRTGEAIAQLDIATTYASDNPFTHYNIGLHFFDLAVYDKALLQAHKAISLGFPQTALRDQLEKIGKWVEPNNTEKLEH